MAAGSLKVWAFMRRGLAYTPVLALATFGGAVFIRLGIPLGWMLGAMAACMLITISGGRLTNPRNLRPPMAVLLGLAIGAGFQPHMVTQMGLWVPSLILVIPLLLLVTFLGTLYFTRVGGYDRLTALYCAIPGGLSEIVLLAENTGADVRRIALVHASRIVLTISTLSLGMGFFLKLDPVGRADASPFVPHAGSYAELGLLVVAGVLVWRIGKRLGLPAPHMIAPLVLSAVVHAAGWMAVELPTVLIASAQVVIGAGIGCRFAGVSLRLLAGIFVHGLFFVAIVIGLCILIALVLTGWVQQPVPTIVLAYSPGGLTELSLLSLAAGLDAGFIAAHHIIRQITVVGLAPFLGRLTSPGASQ